MWRTARRPRWIIVPAPEVIQPRFFVEDIPPIAEEGIERAECVGERTRLADGVASRVVLMLYHGGTITANNGHDVVMLVTKMHVYTCRNCML